MPEVRLREFEELVLLSVLIAAPEAYGASLQQILAREAGRDVSLGAIYTALDRLAHRAHQIVIEGESLRSREAVTSGRQTTKAPKTKSGRQARRRGR